MSGRRLVRAKQKIANAGSPYRYPRRTCCPNACRACSACSTCCSTRGIRARRARTWSGRTSALGLGRPGPYQLQAAIAACHATAPTADSTDWPQIVALYGWLLEFMPTPVVELNHAVAAGQRPAGLWPAWN